MRLTEKVDNEKFTEAGIRYLTRNQDGIYAVLNKLGELEDLEEQGRLNQVQWIPCTDFLPPWNATVLMFIEKADHRKIITIGYNNDDIGWYDLCVSHTIPDEYVVAWMPLPEPYKEGNE